MLEIMTTPSRVPARREEEGSAPSSPSGEPSASMDRPVTRRFWTVRRAAVLGVCALAISSLALLARGLSTSSLEVESSRLSISTVDVRPFQEFTPVTGHVLPRRVFYLGTIEGGRVEELFAEEGDVVEVGQPILRLGNTDLQLEVLRRQDLLAEQINRLVDARLESERQGHESKRRLAELEHEILTQRRVHERDAALYREGLIAELDFELSEAEKAFLERRRSSLEAEEEHNRKFRLEQLQQVESGVARMRENLALARQKLEKLAVRSPVAGLLTALDAEIGESKAPGDRLGQVDVLDDFKVRAAVDEVYLSRVGPGQLAEFDLGGETYRLRVEKTYPEVDGGRFEVDLEFDDRLPPGVQRGQTLHIRLMLGERAEALTIDAGPFFQQSGGRWAYVLDASGGFAERRPISLGRRNADFFEVLDGLEPGDRVVTSSYETLGTFERLVLDERQPR